ncbi:unnamed protein product [Amoebophrya sp. A120]|nr:unnamed protein product [Amoebophrya sp. A120]|eukprot:GSA120T00021027001.1
MMALHRRKAWQEHASPAGATAARAQNGEQYEDRSADRVLPSTTSRVASSNTPDRTSAASSSSSSFSTSSSSTSRGSSSVEEATNAAPAPEGARPRGLPVFLMRPNYGKVLQVDGLQFQISVKRDVERRGSPQVGEEPSARCSGHGRKIGTAAPPEGDPPRCGRIFAQTGAPTSCSLLNHERSAPGGCGRPQSCAARDETGEAASAPSSCFSGLFEASKRTLASWSSPTSSCAGSALDADLLRDVLGKKRGRTEQDHGKNDCGRRCEAPATSATRCAGAAWRSWPQQGRGQEMKPSYNTAERPSSSVGERKVVVTGNFLSYHEEKRAGENCPRQEWEPQPKGGRRDDGEVEGSRLFITESIDLAIPASFVEKKLLLPTRKAHSTTAPPARGPGVIQDATKNCSSTPCSPIVATFLFDVFLVRGRVVFALAEQNENGTTNVDATTTLEPLLIQDPKRQLKAITHATFQHAKHRLSHAGFFYGAPALVASLGAIASAVAMLYGPSLLLHNMTLTLGCVTGCIWGAQATFDMLAAKRAQDERILEKDWQLLKFLAKDWVVFASLMAQAQWHGGSWNPRIAHRTAANAECLIKEIEARIQSGQFKLNSWPAAAQQTRAPRGVCRGAAPSTSANGPPASSHGGLQPRAHSIIRHSLLARGEDRGQDHEHAQGRNARKSAQSSVAPCKGKIVGHLLSEETSTKAMLLVMQLNKRSAESVLRQKKNKKTHRAERPDQSLSSSDADLVVQRRSLVPSPCCGTATAAERSATCLPGDEEPHHAQGQQSLGQLCQSQCSQLSAAGSSQEATQPGGQLSGRVEPQDDRRRNLHHDTTDNFEKPNRICFDEKMIPCNTTNAAGAPGTSATRYYSCTTDKYEHNSSSSTSRSWAPPSASSFISCFSCDICGETAVGLGAKPVACPSKINYTTSCRSSSSSTSSSSTRLRNKDQPLVRVNLQALPCGHVFCSSCVNEQRREVLKQQHGEEYTDKMFAATQGEPVGITCAKCRAGCYAVGCEAVCSSSELLAEQTGVVENSDWDDECAGTTRGEHEEGAAPEGLRAGTSRDCTAGLSVWPWSGSKKETVQHAEAPRPLAPSTSAAALQAAHSRSSDSYLGGFAVAATSRFFPRISVFAGLKSGRQEKATSATAPSSSSLEETDEIVHDLGPPYIDTEADEVLSSRAFEFSDSSRRSSGRSTYGTAGEPVHLARQRSASTAASSRDNQAHAATRGFLSEQLQHDHDLARQLKDGETDEVDEGYVMFEEVEESEAGLLEQHQHDHERTWFTNHGQQVALNVPTLEEDPAKLAWLLSLRVNIYTGKVETEQPVVVERCICRAGMNHETAAPTSSASASTAAHHQSGPATGSTYFPASCAEIREPTSLAPLFRHELTAVRVVAPDHDEEAATHAGRDGHTTRGVSIGRKPWSRIWAKLHCSVSPSAAAAAAGINKKQPSQAALHVTPQCTAQLLKSLKGVGHRPEERRRLFLQEAGTS